MEENTSKVFVGRNGAAFADPLLAPVASATPATSLFVINLCASIAPVQTNGKTIPGFETYKLYQVARSEDGRTRHRLRLGFFTSEADAERVLTAVRDNYPTAFVACLSDDDRRFARGFLPDTEATASWKRPVGLTEKAAAAAPKPVVVKPAVPVPAPTPVKPAATVAPTPVPAKPAAVVAPTPAPAKPVAVVAPTPTPVKPAVVAAPVPAVVAPPAPVKAAPAPAPIVEMDMEWLDEPVAKASSAKASVPADDLAAIELSWDPPALEAPKPAAQVIAAVAKTDTVIKATPTQTPTKPAAPAPEAKKPALKAPEKPVALTLAEPEPAKPAAPAPVAGPAQPFHVGKGIEIPSVSLSLESTGIQPGPAAKAPTPAPVPQKATPAAKETPRKAAVPAAPATPAVAKTPAPAPEKRAAAPAIAASSDRPVPELDSTQTIRALTSAELNDDSQEKWFSIQLVVSERPVNLDAMPHLDIFEAYRVYSIANAGSGKIVYSLRLGFFREEVSAEAVGGYLRTFFPSPTVIRIGAAEQARFKDAPAPKATAVAASKTEGKVIELTQARDRKPNIPTVTMEVADRSPTGAFNPNATGSFNPNATGSFNPNATGAFKPNATGSFKVDASGKHKALKPAAKNGTPATKRSPPLNKASATGRYKALQPKKSLQEQLLDEARDVQLSESAIRKLPKNDSLLSRLVGKLTK